MSTIRSDVAIETPASFEDDDATADAFFSTLQGEDEGDEDASKKKPSGKGTEEDQETDPDDQDDDQEGSDESPETDEEDGDESGDDEVEGKKAFADDGAYVKIKVDGEDKEVAVKDLTRLYGQEASLTRKSQEVAEVRKQAETQAQTHVSALQVLLNRAQEKAKPFQAIDWMGLAKDPNISAEEASALRAEAQKAFEEVDFLGQNLQGFMQEVQKQEQATRIESAKACVKALQTPGTDEAPNPLHVEGWNDKTYNDVRAFGIKMGLPAETVNTLTDPAAFKMMHMAMQFAKGTSKVAVIKTNKVNKTPKKIVKTSNSADPSNAPVAQRKAAIKKLRANPNSVDAVTDAFMASFGGDED